MNHPDEPILDNDNDHDPLGAALQNHLEVRREIEIVRLMEERWQLVEMMEMADGVEIVQPMIVEEDVDWATPSVKSHSPATSSDWFGDDRESMNDVAKYYNNTHLSDINLIVGEESFPAHRLILAKSSEVFDRMFTNGWDGAKKEMELVEDAMCHPSFPAFLRFLYCNHVVLNQDNCLPLLVLADKYNVSLLKKVCLDFAQSEILPRIDTNEMVTVWFAYATTAYHPSLIKACMNAIAFDFETLLSEDWEKRWQSLDRDQMVEILKCNSLKFPNEFKLWEGILKWMQAPNHPERRGNYVSPLLTLIMPLIRFPFMTPDELSLVEESPLVKNNSAHFLPSILLAYKYHSLPLSSRLNCKEFSNKQFLLRRYEDIRWDRRITLDKALIGVPGVDHSFTLMTRSSSFPANDWKWILKLTGRTFSNTNDSDHLRILLIAEDLDQSRSVEYMLQIVDEKKILRSYSGKKTFTKTRYSSELEMEKKIEFGDLLNDDSSLLVNGELVLQLILRPID